MRLINDNATPPLRMRMLSVALALALAAVHAPCAAGAGGPVMLAPAPGCARKAEHCGVLHDRVVYQYRACCAGSGACTPSASAHLASAAAAAVDVVRLVSSPAAALPALISRLPTSGVRWQWANLNDLEADVVGPDSEDCTGTVRNDATCWGVRHIENTYIVMVWHACLRSTLRLPAHIYLASRKSGTRVHVQHDRSMFAGVTDASGVDGRVASGSFAPAFLSGTGRVILPTYLPPPNLKTASVPLRAPMPQQLSLFTTNTPYVRVSASALRKAHSIKIKITASLLEM
ncbi:hypothetical protein GGX14DRAFT_581416 [Mycena pura]|uniref:Uncharacterized protein n=1 Tax=Mycena pura TaxID=153505 RepID=A0AAD7E5C6_9AGAR|nr:hypothetical protein GGX14DRAFT_581416 [Mycena pura]